MGWVAGPVAAVHQKNIGVAIPVVIQKSAPAADGLRHPFFPECPVDVHKVDAGLTGNVREKNARGIAFLMVPGKVRALAGKLLLFPGRLITAAGGQQEQTQNGQGAKALGGTQRNEETGKR